MKGEHKSPTDREYWFKPRSYGFGWGTPTSWKGWVVLGVYFALLLTPLVWMSRLTDERVEEIIWYYLVYQAGITVALIKVVSAHGPPPKWRWGKRSRD